MLGSPGGAFTTGHRQLTPGTSLVLYTDGLIEDRHRDITEGLGQLAGAMRQAAGLTAEQTCTTVQAALLGTTARAYDVCLLAARLTSSPLAGLRRAGQSGTVASRPGPGGGRGIVPGVAQGLPHGGDSDWAPYQARSPDTRRRPDIGLSSRRGSRAC
jgi:hypothetical protein